MSLNDIHSQATNFMDAIKTGVDSRTGQFSIALQLPLLPANRLAGPALSPTLAFSVMASSRNRGFGLGWALDLSELNLHQDAPALHLSSGERFAVDLDSSDLAAGGELVLFDAKLKSMIVTCLSDDVVQVMHKNGVTELLTRQQDSPRFLLTEVSSPEGRRLFVDWSAFANNDFILESIRDESRTLLQVESDDGEVRFTVPELNRELLRLQLSNEMLGDIFLPGIDTPFSVFYDQHRLDQHNHLLLPTTLTSPLGASDSLVWGTADHGHQLPEGAPFDVLPRVVEWKHSSGTPGTELNTSYVWAGTHNFLGYGSDQAFDWALGRDNLYQVEQDYDYQVLESQTDSSGETLSTITRTWNRFHLLTSEIVKRGLCEIHTETTYGIEPDTPWEDQPAWCQLPHKQKVTYINARQPDAQRSETTEYRYDDSGNVVFTRFPSGIEEHSEFYPAEGADGCPANVLGMVRYLKEKTVRPALTEDGTYGGACEVSTRYIYTSLAPLVEGKPPLVLVSREDVHDETNGQAIEKTVQSYITEKGPDYARIQSTTTQINGKDTTTRYRYEYTQSELNTHVSIWGFENTERVHQSHSSARSLITGLMTRERSLTGVLSHYTHDSLGRLIESINGYDSPYQTTSTSSFHVGDSTAQAHRIEGVNPVMIEHTLATGQRRRDWLDGDGRTVRVEAEDIDHAPGTFREIVRTEFDAQGRTTRETQTDWLRDERNPATVTPLELSTATFYDGWGQVIRTTTPDGVETHNERDPVKLTLKQWQQNGETRGPSLVTHLDKAGDSVQQQLYSSDEVLVRSTQWVRDGLGRITQTRIKLAGQPDQVNTVRHDVYSRVVEQQLPDGTVLNWTYALHSDNHHPESIAVTPAPE